jgi:hypothetical protein
MLQIACPSCTKLLNVPDEARGRQAKCPFCASVFEVRSADATPVSDAPLPPAPPRPASVPDDRYEKDDSFDDRAQRRPRRGDRDISISRFESPDEEQDALYWGRRASRGAATLMYIAFALGVVLVLLSVVGVFGDSGRNRGDMIPFMICTIVLFLPQFAFVLVGGIFMSVVRTRGMALSGAILALTAGGLLIIMSLVFLIVLAESSGRFNRAPAWLWLLVLTQFIAAIMHLVAGVRALVVLSRPDVKHAFDAFSQEYEGRYRY